MFAESMTPRPPTGQQRSAPGTNSTMTGMKELDPNRLLFLLGVVRAGSISAGARALGWTQQALSQHLRDLEHQAGVPVLLRHNRGVRPTDAGRALLVHAEAIAAHLEAAGVEIEEFSQRQRGTVRLAAYWSAMASLVPQALAVLESGIDVDLITAGPVAALEMLRSGDIDLAIVFRFAGDARGDPGALVPVDIGRETYHVIARADHPAFARPDLRLADLARETWVVGCEDCRRHLTDAARAAGFVPRIIHGANDHMVAQSFVAHGLACSILPRTAYDACAHPQLTSRGFPELADRTVVAFHRAGADHVPSIAAMLEALRRAA